MMREGISSGSALYTDDAVLMHRKRLLRQILLALAGPGSVFGLVMAIMWVLGETPVTGALAGFSVQLFYLLAYWLSRRGRERLAAYVPVLILFLVMTAASYQLGVGHATLVGYAMVTLTAGILIGTRVALLFALLSTGAHLVIGIAQTSAKLPGAVSPEATVIADGVGLGLGLVVLATFRALSDREMFRLLHSARELTASLRAQQSEMGQQVAERKQAEESLKNSEERFRLIFEYAPDAYYLNDFKGVFVDGNKAAEALIGYQKEELIGKSFLKLNLLPPRQIPKAAALLAKNLLGQPTGPDEFTLKQRDDSQVIVEISTFPVVIWRALW